MKFEIEGLIPQHKRYLTNEEYEFVFSRCVRLCLDFVIKRSNKILLSKRTYGQRKGCWSLTGGLLRYKESVEDGSKRILMEAFGGMNFKENRFIGHMEFINEGLFHSLSLVFLTTLESKEFLLNNEAKWFSRLPKKNLHPEHGSFLKENWQTIMKIPEQL